MDCYPTYQPRQVIQAVDSVMDGEGVTCIFKVPRESKRSTYSEYLIADLQIKL